MCHLIDIGVNHVNRLTSRLKISLASPHNHLENKSPIFMKHLKGPVECTICFKVVTVGFK